MERREFVDYWFMGDIWAAWIICHSPRTLARTDTGFLDKVVRAGIIFG